MDTIILNGITDTGPDYQLIVALLSLIATIIGILFGGRYFLRNKQITKNKTVQRAGDNSQQNSISASNIENVFAGGPQHENSFQKKQFVAHDDAWKKLRVIEGFIFSLTESVKTGPDPEIKQVQIALVEYHNCLIDEEPYIDDEILEKLKACDGIFTHMIRRKITDREEGKNSHEYFQEQRAVVKENIKEIREAMAQKRKQ